MKLTQFIARHNIRMSAELADANPNMADMPEGSTHWHCVLSCGRRRMTVYFSQGPAICREPTCADVLDCLASDASGVDSASGFEGWCADYGYDTDSRKAERTFKTVEAQTVALTRLLGAQDYETLLYNVERM